LRISLVFDRCVESPESGLCFRWCWNLYAHTAYSIFRCTRTFTKRI
jgi:hypothetical protein